MSVPVSIIIYFLSGLLILYFVIDTDLRLRINIVLFRNIEELVVHVNYTRLEAYEGEDFCLR